MTTTALPNTSETIYNAWLAEAAYADFGEAFNKLSKFISPEGYRCNK